MSEQPIPARMLNEFTYCPRLAYLEYVQKEWADNADTAAGTRAHKRVDRPGGKPRKKDDENVEPEVIHQRSVTLSSKELGLVAKLDLVEGERCNVRPVDYKKGRKPQVPGGAWEPEKVQLCAQGLLLREAGYRCHEGILYFAGSRQRVRVRFTDNLVERTRAQLRTMREMLDVERIPDPLQDSPKCNRCSLVSICLPEETNFLRATQDSLRPLVAPKLRRHPLVVQEPGARVRLSGQRLIVEKQGETLADARLGETSELLLMGGAHCTSAVLRECCRHDIPVAHMSGTGNLYGVTRGTSHRNVEIRLAQFEAATCEERSLPVARALVGSKIANARVLLRRNGEAHARDLALMEGCAKRARKAESIEKLLGIEGHAGRIYYSNFGSMLGNGMGFDFEGRNRRPPRDRANALLSFCYALLVKEWIAAIERVGLDPYLGFYHQPRYGRPALALDLMETFRPIVADSVVVQCINNREVKRSAFREEMGGILLKPAARRSVFQAWERRMTGEITHPLFGYRCSYRRVFEVQTRLLSRYLLGEIEEYPEFRVR
ncbi:MAG: CRISPR-associated endonuclease Cas1 [Acidobacteriota bacterium]